MKPLRKHGRGRCWRRRLGAASGAAVALVSWTPFAVKPAVGGTIAVPAVPPMEMTKLLGPGAQRTRDQEEEKVSWCSGIASFRPVQTHSRHALAIAA